MNISKKYLSIATAGLMLSAGSVQADELTANAGAASNYLWRGLTQSVNEAARFRRYRLCNGQRFLRWHVGIQCQLRSW